MRKKNIIEAKKWETGEDVMISNGWFAFLSENLKGHLFASKNFLSYYLRNLFDKGFQGDLIVRKRYGEGKRVNFYNFQTDIKKK